MKYKFISAWLIISVIWICPINAANQCITDKVFVQTVPVSRVIFRFQCNGTDLNPIIPANQGSSPVEFNELDLSPNIYTSVPYTQICQFANLYLLDLSYNLITNVTNVFANLGCLTKLTQIDLSHNKISTPILASDFSDTVAGHLGSLNLGNNQIPSIESGAFFNSNGSTRFANLSYLGLARNNIMSIDLLWPMTMPNGNLRVELNNNPIGSLVNPLRSNFVSNVFIPMTGNRYVDMRNTSLTSLADSQLLQYGLNSADDFKNFLFKISNYDFRGTQFVCTCPASTGLYTVYWYGQFLSAPLNPSALIYQLTCSNYLGDYIFDFPCQFTGTISPQFTSTSSTTKSSTSTLSIKIVSTTTTTTTTTNPSSLSSSPITVTTNMVTTTTTTTITTTSIVVNSVGQLVNGGTDPTTTTSQNNLYLLFLLIVPLLLILLLLFLCCYGRVCLTCLHNSCSISMCSCFRPDAKNSTTKLYDATICYNEFDENWIDQRFMPFFGDICKKAKCAKLTKFVNGENSNLSQADVDKLKSSKRIILIVTKKFLNEEWKNKPFRDLLAEINRQDAYCSIILINLSEIDEDQLVNITNDIELRNNVGPILKFKYALANNMKYNCGLRDVETLDWHESNFWSKLNYLMPHTKLKTQMSAPKNTRAVRGKTDSPEPVIGNEEGRDSIIIENENSLVTRLKKINEAKRVTPVNKDDLITDFGTKDDQFWNSLVITKSDFNYEPVGLAGSAVSGNREANLNRFGVPITHSPLAIDKVSFRKMPTNSSNRVNSSSNSSNSNLVDTEQNQQPTGRILIPTELVSRTLEGKGKESQNVTEELEIRETDGARNVKTKVSKKKTRESDDDEFVVEKPKKINALPPVSPRKEKKVNGAVAAGKATTNQQKKDDYIEFDSNNSNQNDSDDILIQKPKKRVVISTELNTEKNYNLSSEDNQEILNELDAYLNEASAKTKKKKSGKKAKRVKSEEKEKVVNKKDINDDYLYDFEID